MVTETNYINASVISPSDSSLWIATSVRGLVRIGKNGKTFAYSGEKGDFASNNIVSLAFDNEGVLWIKDAEGSVYSYTSFSGFVRQTDIPQNIATQLSGPVLTEEQAVAPQPEPAGHAWYGSWWFLLLTVLLLTYAVYTIFKGRGRVETPKQEPAAPPVAELEPSAPESLVSKPATPQETIKKTPAPKAAVSKPVPQKPNVTVPESGTFYEQVYALAKKNFTNPEFGVEDVAAALGMSRVHLNRKLKAENSPSPSDIIKTMRMDYAVEMLKDGSHTISEIAAASGFSSASYFSSAFKEFFGVAPAAYGK